MTAIIEQAVSDAMAAREDALQFNGELLANVDFLAKKMTPDYKGESKCQLYQLVFVEAYNTGNTNVASYL